MSQRWEQLPVVSDAALPKLLYRFTTYADAYEFLVTDLVRIWTEKLTRKDILDRAVTYETSIDPGEDSEQFEVFLQKLREALSGGENGQVSIKADAEAGEFDIVTKSELPAPLEALEWTFCVTRGTPKEFASQVVVPLLEAQVEHDESEKSLLKILKDKDWVLGKIFDKIESLGLDLTSVFPGTAGLRMSEGGKKRAHAAKYVPGLAAFDESSWRNEIDREGTFFGLAHSLIDASTRSSHKKIQPDKLLPDNDEWWRVLNDYKADESSRTRHRITKPPAILTSHASAGENNDEDEFERQETPPRLKRKQAVDSNAHESDDQLDTERNVSPKGKIQKAETGRVKLGGIGKIGGRKTKGNSEPAPETTFRTKDAPVKSNINESEETASEEESKLSPSSKPTSASKPKLGTISGRKAKISPPPSKEATARPSTDDQSQSLPSSPAKHGKTDQKRGARLGIIGGKKTQIASHLPKSGRGATDSTASEEDEHDDLDDLDRTHESKAVTRPTRKMLSPIPSPSPPPKPAPPKEAEQELTAQEKADKKREKLKRELDAKTKTPSKKKRKF